MNSAERVLSATSAASSMDPPGEPLPGYGDEEPVPSNAEAIEMTDSPHSGRDSEAAAFLSVHSSVRSGGTTLKRKQRAWVDEYEPRVQDTFYQKTLDTLRPNFANTTRKKNIKDIKDLFDGDVKEEDEEESEDKELAEAEADAQQPKVGDDEKLGTWDGVFANCLLNIFGVIMFLRVGWVVGQTGVAQALLIMVISAVVTILTTLSMSAICTNGEIKSGGAYYLISRSLGPAVGGSVGILFSLGNMIAVSMYLIGFSETLVQHAGGALITGDDVGDVRIFSNIMLVVVLLLALGGLKYVVKVQLFLLAFIVVSIICFFIGSFYRTAKEKFDDDMLKDWKNCKSTLDDDVVASIESGNKEKVKILFGSTGWSNGNLDDNMDSYYAETDGIKYDFFKTLAVFFPAVTGIMAGANISGDLQNPSVNIPVGTLSAVSLSTVVYMMFALFVGAVTSRCALLNDYLIMSRICVNEYLVLIGIYCATASSGIASLVGAPRILQAVAKDKIFPWKWLDYFSVLDDEGNPKRGYFLSFGVAFCCNLIGELNLVAPLITDFFMIAYFMINFACFFLEIGKTPGWRPSFQYFNRYTAICGAILCLVIMFLMEWTYALGGVMIALGLYFYVRYEDPDINWGSASDSRAFYEAYKALLKLRKTRQHVKNWRPGFLVLTKNPGERPHMMLFAQTLRKSYGPIIYARIKTGDYRTDMRRFHRTYHQGYLPEDRLPKKIKGFYDVVLADNFRQGSQMLLQLSGLGGIRPNTLVIGFCHSWKRIHDQTSQSEERQKLRRDKVVEYVQILKDTIAMGFGVIVCSAFREVNWLMDHYVPPPTMRETSDGEFDMYEQTSAVDVRMLDEEQQYDNQETWGKGQGKNPIIDVWWLIDDGGLTILLPHLMRLHSFWSHCVLRVNVLYDDQVMTTEVVAVEKLIKQFRLNYVTPRRISIGRDQPSVHTVKYFEKMAGRPLDKCAEPQVIARYLRVSELIAENSKFSGLVIVTLPLPYKEEDPFAYMALLESICRPRRNPPMILMRGNGDSVLTWYSD